MAMRRAVARSGEWAQRFSNASCFRYVVCLVCAQGAVVDGVYTRGVQPCHMALSDVGATAICRHVQVDDGGGCIESPAAVQSVTSISRHTPVTDSMTVVSSSPCATTTSVAASTQQSTAVVADVSATLSLHAAIQLPLCSACSPSLGSPPLKPGILPPTTSVNVESASVGAASSATDASEDWKEFEEALSEEFVASSSASAAAAAADSCQSKAAVSSRCMQQQQALRGALTPSHVTQQSTVPHLLVLCT